MKLLLFFGFTISICSQSLAQMSDTTVIKNICLAETKAYNDHDFDKLASFHVQGPTDQITWNNADGSFGHHIGWDSFAKGLKDWFATAKKEKLEQTSDNFQFYISGDLAFISYSTISKDEQGKITKLWDYKTLKRIKGQWKILATQAYSDFSKSK